MTRILLVRHGQSTWNADRRWQGQADPPLTPLGEHQAREAARSLGTFDALGPTGRPGPAARVGPTGRPGPAASVGVAGRPGPAPGVVASPLRRARRTAELLGDELGLGPVEIEPELMERAVGVWSGLTFEEIEAGWPGALERRDWPEGFEHDDTFAQRIQRAMSRLEARFPDGLVLAVTHGGVLHGLDRQAGQPQARYSNLSGRWLDVVDGRVRLGDRLDLVVERTGGGRPELGREGEAGLSADTTAPADASVAGRAAIGHPARRPAAADRA